MWSKKPMPVEILLRPAPSTQILTEISRFLGFARDFSLSRHCSFPVGATSPLANGQRARHTDVGRPCKPCAVAIDAACSRCGVATESPWRTIRNLPRCTRPPSFWCARMERRSSPAMGRSVLARPSSRATPEKCGAWEKVRSSSASPAPRRTRSPCASGSRPSWSNIPVSCCARVSNWRRIGAPTAICAASRR